jgi:hypothetical protein
VENLGEFAVCSVIVPGGGIGNVVIGSMEPQAVFSNFIRMAVCCMKTGYFDLNGGLEWGPHCPR